MLLLIDDLQPCIERIYKRNGICNFNACNGIFRQMLYHHHESTQTIAVACYQYTLATTQCWPDDLFPHGTEPIDDLRK